jgi:hypothetical protein
VTHHDESEDEQQHMGASDRGENGEEALTTVERRQVERSCSESEQNIHFWEPLCSFTLTTKHPPRKDGMAPFYLALEPNTS